MGAPFDDQAAAYNRWYADLRPAGIGGNPHPPGRYFPPWKNLRLARCYSYLEKLGNKLPLSTGSFLAVVARKRITPPYLSNYPYLCWSTRRLWPARQRSGQAATSSGRPKGSDTCKGKWGNILPGGEDQGGINLLPVTA
jgi:hypothetical protein